MTTTITARCLCKAHTFSTTLPTSDLPLSATCCHCDSCRHVTGSLYLSSTIWPNPNENLSSLKTYAFSKNITHYSCPTCSTLIFCRSVDSNQEDSNKDSNEEGPGELEVLTGALENLPNLIKYTKHIFVGDTRDGGASIWFARRVDDKEKPIPRWEGFSNGKNGSTELSEAWPGQWLSVVPVSAPASVPAAAMGEDHSQQAHQGQQGEQREGRYKDRGKAYPKETPLTCHCGGVNLIIRSAEDVVLDDSQKNWYIDPESRRYYGGVDGCDSCRLQLGVDLAFEAFVGLDHIAFPSSDSEKGQGEGGKGEEKAKFPKTVFELAKAVSEKDPRMGKLGIYHSSDDVDRYFCTECSAAVFYAVHDRQDMVDVAAGLLRHPDGARADGLVAWNYGVVGWQEDVVGGWREGLLRAATEQSEEWRVRHGVPKSWRRLQKEAGIKSE